MVTAGLSFTAAYFGQCLPSTDLRRLSAVLVSICGRGSCENPDNLFCQIALVQRTRRGVASSTIELLSGFLPRTASLLLLHHSLEVLQRVSGMQWVRLARTLEL